MYLTNESAAGHEIQTLAQSVCSFLSTRENLTSEQNVLNGF